MKKIKNFLLSTPGKIMMALVALLVIVYFVREKKRNEYKENLRQYLISNNNWGVGLPDGKTWERLAQALYDLQKKNGELDKYWWK